MPIELVSRWHMVGIALALIVGGTLESLLTVRLLSVAASARQTA
jgi:hypothetical protein